MDMTEQFQQEMKELFREVLEEEMDTGDCRIARKWDGGMLVFQPHDSSLQSKEIPVEIFFKKITSVREKLRVLEQKLNNHPALSCADKAEFQSYITRSYGSLTSFNFLFREEKERFSGQKTDEE